MGTYGEIQSEVSAINVYHALEQNANNVKIYTDPYVTQEDVLATLSEAD